MNRNLERVLIKVAGIWEIILGLLTIFIYAPFYRQHGIEIEGLSVFQSEAVHSLFGGIYIFVVSFGIAFILMGMINLHLSHKLPNKRIEKRIPIIWIVMGVISYLAMDIIGGILCLTAGVLTLSKNKAIDRLENNY